MTTPEEKVVAWEQARAASVADAGALDEGDVHIWLLPLDAPPRPFGELVAALDPDERHRASRFHFPRDRRRFEAGRGLLRFLIGGYTDTAPDAVRFVYGPQGKPLLPNAAGAAQLEFNVAHSAGWALLGVTRGCAIGVDLEAVREVPELEDIARRNFAPGELESLLRLSPLRRTEGFLACWTRKEAFVKALGGGLSVPLERFEVSLSLDQSAELLSIGGSASAAAAWSIWGLRPLAGFWGAVAVQGRNLNLRRLRLT